MNNNSGKLKSVALMSLSSFLWGSSFAVTKGAAEALPTNLLVALRLFLGGFIVALVYWKRLKNVSRGLILCSLINGLFYCGGMVLQTLGVKYTSAGRSAFVTSAYCIIIPVLEWIINKHKPKLNVWLAALVCLAGVGLIVLKGDFTVDSGDIYTLAGSMSFAMEIVLFGKFSKKQDDILLSSFQLMAAGIFAIILFAFTETLPTAVSTGTVLAVLYLAIACSGFPMVFQGIAQRVLQPSVVSIILGFEAVFAAILSAMIYNETFTGKCLIGCVLVFLSAFLALLERKNPSEKTA